MLFKPTFWLKSVLQIDEKFLTENGVKALVLDMDNTLSMHGNPAAEAGVDEWLGKMRALGVKMRVVSNNTNRRVAPDICGKVSDCDSGGAAGAGVHRERREAADLRR